jgi:exonuclease III
VIENADMKVATWNTLGMKTGGDKISTQWKWLEETVNADVAVLTEAKVPVSGIPEGWNAFYKPGGVGNRRPWGTIVAARNYEIRDVTDGVSGLRGFKVNHTWPGTVTIADIMVKDKLYATVAGVYGITLDLDGKSNGSGWDSIPTIFDDLGDLISSRRGKRLIVAGDFNLLPESMNYYQPKKMINVVEFTAGTRPQLSGCTGCSMGDDCGHMWTHKNGNKPGAKVQHLDNIYVSKELVGDIVSVVGGISDFPSIMDAEGKWELSDHAPVVVEFAV